MSDATAVTLADVRAAARAIVNHQPRRGAIGVSVKLVNALAHSFCALDDIARLAAEYRAAFEQMSIAGKSGDVAGEQAADDRMAEIDAELTDALIALGYAHIIPEQETTDERAD